MKKNEECSSSPIVRPEYLFTDPPCAPDTPMESLSSYGSLDFVSHGSHLYGQIMWPDASFSKPRPCVIMFHGYPGTARHDDILHALVRIGCVTVSPHHRGAWGSEGKYLVTNCIEDAMALAEYVHGEEFCKQYNVDPDRIYIMGHSMGGNTSIHTGAALPWLRGIILLAPFDPTYFVRHDRMDDQMFVLRDGYPLHWDGVESVCRNIDENLEAMVFDDDLAKLAASNRNVLCIVGDADIIAPPGDMVKPIWDRVWSPEHPNFRPLLVLHTDHDLFGQRVRATKAIADFICETV